MTIEMIVETDEERKRGFGRPHHDERIRFRYNGEDYLYACPEINYCYFYKKDGSHANIFGNYHLDSGMFIELGGIDYFIAGSKRGSGKVLYKSDGTTSTDYGGEHSAIWYKISFGGEDLLVANSKKAFKLALFREDGSVLKGYGLPHYAIINFIKIGEDFYLTAKNKIGKGFAYYRKDGKKTFGGKSANLHPCCVYGMYYVKADVVSTKTRFFSNNKIVSKTRKTNTHYFSLEGTPYDSIDQIKSMHPTLKSLSGIGLFDLGKEIYNLVEGFTSDNKPEEQKQVFNSLDKSITKIIMQNVGNREQQIMDVTHALLQLKDNIRSKPMQFMQEMGCAR